MNIYFAFSECPDPHQLKFVQYFSTQPISNYFTLQGYIALGISTYLHTYLYYFRICKLDKDIYIVHAYLLYYIVF